LVPDVALVSDAARTRQTWGIVAGQLPVSANVDVRHSVALYAAYVDDVIDALAEVDDEAATVIVVGHEPTISSTAARLAGPGSDLGACAEVRVGVPTATYALLTFDGPWSGLGQGTARLVSVVRP
jgi:phosphohistidine phosphatase